MESIKVDTEALRKAATNVDKMAEDYERTYRNLLNNVQTFTSADWTGDDANAFKEKVFDFQDDLNNMKSLMNEYANTLRTFATNYEDTQRKITQQAQSMSS